jgi:sugar phosphate isomerase/epimerase
MELGFLTVPFKETPLKEVLPYLKSLGITALELGAGGYPGTGHIDPAKLLESEGERKALLAMLSEYGMSISALACHGNPVSPDKAFAKESDETLKNTILLAEKLSVKTVITFSGCPAGAPGDKTPCWVTCPWPDEYAEALKYQWNEVLIPYWKSMNAFAAAHGVRVALEMHPGFCVYNPETLLRLRSAVGSVIGANFDPSHLIWQGIQPASAVRELAGAIYHVHAKDTKIDAINTARHGVLDTKHYGDELNRSWIFRTCGYGNPESWWREFFSELQLAGYEGPVSIEHEDSLMSVDEGLKKAVQFLRPLVIEDDTPSAMGWA